MLDTNFKSVLANCEGDPPEFLQILDIGNEGYMRKEVLVVMEEDTKIIVYKISSIRLLKVYVFKFSQKLRFDRNSIGLKF